MSPGWRSFGNWLAETSDSELALVGQMVDEAQVQVGDERIYIELYILF